MKKCELIFVYPTPLMKKLIFGILLSANLTQAQEYVIANDDVAAVAYDVPVVYQAPVVYNAPVIYNAPVYYLAAANPSTVVATSYAEQVIYSTPDYYVEPTCQRSSPNVIFMSGSIGGSSYSAPCHATPNVIIIGRNHSSSRSMPYKTFSSSSICRRR